MAPDSRTEAWQTLVLRNEDEFRNILSCQLEVDNKRLKKEYRRANLYKYIYLHEKQGVEPKIFVTCQKPGVRHMLAWALWKLKEFYRD